MAKQKEQKCAEPTKAELKSQEPTWEANKDWQETVWPAQLKNIKFDGPPEKNWDAECMVAQGIRVCPECGTNDVISMGIGSFRDAVNDVYLEATLPLHWCACGYKWIDVEEEKNRVERVKDNEYILIP